MNATHTPSRRRGFTLIELTMALVVTTVLVGAVGSLVVMTTRAAAGNPKAQTAASSAADAMDRFVSELSYAMTVSEATATSVAFTVADRDNNGQPEAIRYSWGGAGNPLTRELNGGSAVAVTGRLDQLNLAYTTTNKTISTTVNNVVDSGEVLLAGFTGWSGGIVPAPRELGITASIFASQFFAIDRVSLPNTLTELNITKVRLMARRGSTGNLIVSIQAPGASPQPDGVNKGTTISTPFAALPAAQAWVDFPFDDVSFSGKLTDFNIVVKGTGTTTAFVRYLDANTAPNDTPVFLFSTDTGAAWQPASGRNRYDMPFEVYGSYKSNTTTQVDVDTYTLHSVSVSAKPNGGASPAVTKVRTLNRPIVPATVTASADAIPSL